MRWRRKSPPSEATRAREQAERDLEAIRAETPKYRALGSSLREMVEENHLAQALTESFRSSR
jgi:cell fate (sporulation/competence/biofilm development) regulator YlbF (YheA/YmcA/DUF963 family)